MTKKNLSGVFDGLLSKHHYHWRLNRGGTQFREITRHFLQKC
jgi:hypothetical protein